MEARNLIKIRISELKEKELTSRLSHDELVELGKLYITDQNNDKYEQLAILQNQEYWKSRCQLIEKFFSETPCEHDKSEAQVEAREEYEHFINTNKEPGT